MIGKNIYKIRKSRGLSLSELSEKSGISKSYLSNIERNVHQNPSIQILEKVALVLNVDLNALLISDYETLQQNDQELIEFIMELKKSGIDKDNLHRYQELIDFINWQNQKVKINKKEMHYE